LLTRHRRRHRRHRTLVTPWPRRQQQASLSPTQSEPARPATQRLDASTLLFVCCGPRNTCVPVGQFAPPNQTAEAGAAAPTASSACCGQRSTFSLAHLVAAPTPAATLRLAMPHFHHHYHSYSSTTLPAALLLLQPMPSAAGRRCCLSVAAAVRLGYHDGQQRPPLLVTPLTVLPCIGCPPDPPEA
jgi:hypothetical protein